ncbi:MAG: TonB-dependent receptor [Bacteroidales bacterium]|nr:TonB-dependent receptor [Bacteroidales bacterium]
MKSLIIIILASISFINLNAQHILKGKITDKKGHAIIGANVYIKNSYYGTSSDTSGHFSFEFEKGYNDTLVVNYIGYNSYENEVSYFSDIQDISIKLTESVNNINAVVISAGAFEASDEKKSATMTSLDIVTTASGEADLYGAYNTMPGTQKVGEKGELFVRGGDDYEAKTYMDGMLVQKPYSASMPNLPSRSRFSPFLFKGTVFSTGGYSAEFGQALSSVLILDTKGVAEKNMTEITLLSVGASASQTLTGKNNSITLSANYQNLAPYFSLIKQEVDWKKSPESFGGNIIFRQKTGKNGMLKTFFSGSVSESRLSYPNYEIGTVQLINLQNKNAYGNTVYTDMLSPKMKIKFGIAYNFNLDDIDINNDNAYTKENAVQSVLNFKYFYNNNLAVKFGTEIYNFNYYQNYFYADLKQTFNSNFENTVYSSFAEAEIKLTSKFAARIGGRFEHSSISNENNISPRISLAIKTSTFSQFSIAYGTFYQTAQNDFLKFNNDLKSEESIHYIANWQYVVNNRIFRVEAYYKDYKELVKYEFLNSPVKNSYNNSGKGYAKGFDVFWQDKQTFKKSFYRISYSFIDTKRDYLNYKEAATPIFSSKHNLAFVYNQWINKISTYLGLTYSYSSGRPYYNPNNKVFLSDRTQGNYDLSFNASYLTEIWGSSTIVHLSVSNVLGFDKIYGYRYDNQPNENNEYEAHPIKPAAKRFAVIALIMKF